MSTREVLVMAMTKMTGGICTAGFVHEPAERLCRWVRPVKAGSAVLLGDMTAKDGRTVRMGDVVDLHLLRPRTVAPHVEDWETDFTKQRPRVIRALEGERRAEFLARHCDAAPADVLVRHTRSLCLLAATLRQARFETGATPEDFKARLLFDLPDAPSLDELHLAGLENGRGLPVTDLKWRALGRSWLAAAGASSLALEADELAERLGAQHCYFSLGLTRLHTGVHWPLVIGVHPVPDYECDIDYAHL